MADQPVAPSPSPDRVPVAPLNPEVGPVPEGPRRHSRRFDRRLLLPLGIVVVIVAVLVAQLPQFLGSSSSAGQTVWQRITSGITDAGVPKDTALEAFAYVYKVDIPGVAVPSGVDGHDAPTSGTGVMRWVQANWNGLTPAQQAVIDRYLLPAVTKGTVQMKPTASRKAAGGLYDVRPPSPGSGTSSLAAPTGWPFLTNVAPDASPDLALAMADDISAIIVHLAPKLGLPVIYPGAEADPDITLTLSDVTSGVALLNTLGIQASDAHFSPCNIVAFKNTWGDKAYAPGTTVTPVMHVLLTHEVVHCFQNATIGNVFDALTMPSFIMEGTAIYLAAEDTHVAEPALPDTWKNYLNSEAPLLHRTYDAIGYYSLLATKGRDMWGLLPTAWRAAAKTTPPQRSDTFLAVLHGDDSDIRDNWAQSYMNATPWGDPWILHGFDAPAGIGDLHLIQALADPGWTGSLEPRSNTLLYVQETSGEVVTIVANNGLVSVRDKAGHSDIAFQAKNFCTVQSCVCPPGTALAGQDMAPAHIDIPFFVAVNAPEAGTGYHVIGSTLEELCRRKPTPRPTTTSAPKGPCPSGGCPGSNGDPHMLTVNRFRYDFQAAGEFTLLRSIDGSVDIQERQEPYGQNGAVSINTAIAATLGSHKVGVYVAADGSLQAHVDGSVADLSAGPRAVGGGQIARIDRGFEVDFPDGTVLYALLVGHWGINAQLRVSASLAATGTGLLGKVTPGGLGVPNLPDGTWLKIAPDEATRNQILYGQFADAWRVTDANSLFDYDAGKSTATYTIKPYPDPKKVLTSAQLSAAQQDAGNRACSAISDAGLREDCVFDVAVSGQAGFADSYTAVQTFYDAGVATPTPAPATHVPATPPPAGKVNGAWQVTQGVAVAGFAIGPNDIVYANVQTGDNTFSLMALDPAKQAVLAQVPVPAATEVHVAAGSVWLPGLEADSNGNICSVTRFDAATLAKQARIAVPCGFFGKPEMASDGDAMWFVDVSKYDLGTSKGAVMTRLDPATSAPGTSVPLPFINGYRIDSQGAFFYYGTDASHGYYRLAAGGAAFDQLGQLRAPAHAAGAGLWVGSQDGKSATYYTSSSTPAATVTTGGSLVAADEKAVYVEVLGNNATSGDTEEQLWRYPADGSAPAQLASAPTLDGSFLNYFGDPMPIANGDGVLKFWSTRSGNNPLRLILLQWVPTK